MKRNILILGGSSEGFDLAEILTNDQTYQTRYDCLSSLAGRTSLPRKPSGAYRTGGFGGPDGLADFLKAEQIDALIDATHPFAAAISQNASRAAKAASIPCLHITRPAWEKQDGDHWINAPTAKAAAALLKPCHSPVFLTIGRLELDAFTPRNDITFLTRAIEPPSKSDPKGLKGETLPENFTPLYGKGPFFKEEEKALMQTHGIRAVVSKNSGSPKAYAKIEVAREMKIPVIMIDRPALPSGEHVTSVSAALSWLEAKFLKP